MEQKQDNSNPKKVPNQFIPLLWEKGVLSFKFRPVQKKIYQTWIRSKKTTKKLVCIGSRRLGKSTVGFSICLEEAIRKPNSNILFITPVNKNVDRYVQDIANEIMVDCPTNLRPEFLPQKAMYVFKNGSKIFCVGSSNQSYENLRGTRVNLAVIDEAQRMDDLEIIVDEVVMPSMLDSNGFLLIFGTVPRQSNHPFMRRYVADAERTKSYVEFDIYQAGYPAERIEIWRGETSKEAFEREYECKRNTGKHYNVTPGFLPKHIRMITKPDHFQYLKSYTGMDIGGALDQTHILFAYYDSVIKKLVITSEAVWAAQESRVDRIAEKVKNNEKKNLTKKILRVCDTNNFILVKELQERHRLIFSPVKKGPGSLEAQLEILNIWIENDRILIDPSCKVLIHELKTGCWNKTRTDLERHEGCHLDGTVALAYLLTIVNERASIKQEETETGVFVPPEKDPLNLKVKKLEVSKDKNFDEAFDFKEVTSSIWKKEL